MVQWSDQAVFEVFGGSDDSPVLLLGPSEFCFEWRLQMKGPPRIILTMGSRRIPTQRGLAKAIEGRLALLSINAFASADPAPLDGQWAETRPVSSPPPSVTRKPGDPNDGLPPNRPAIRHRYGPRLPPQSLLSLSHKVTNNLANGFERLIRKELRLHKRARHSRNESRSPFSSVCCHDWLPHGAPVPQPKVRGVVAFAGSMTGYAKQAPG
jgi:hypothetical protein